ncbi:MAG: P1 family peptidase [Acidimicrobiales bacterium]
MRARDAGVVVGTGTPGPGNAITDVAGVAVGHATILRGDGRLVVGQGPVRTGVTIVVPHDGVIWEEPLFAGCHRLNGNGELTGLEWVRESGMLMSPIGLTNTHSVGVVRDALIRSEVRVRPTGLFWGLPVVGETWDGMLNDINGFHVGVEHVEEALAAASPGPVAEGGVGSGTGMICHGFKGGIGTASRVLAPEAGSYTVGVLVQANHGRRERLTVNGVRVGEAIPADEVPVPEEPRAPATPATPRAPATPGAPGAAGAGSIIVVVATDAPLLPLQCGRLAQRAGLGVARIGGVGEHTSGDIFICFSTANRGMTSADIGTDVPLTMSLEALVNSHITPLFDATVEATEEAIVNCLVAAETMTGRDGIIAHGLDPGRLGDLVGASR